MELKQCKNGHFYESTLDSCPTCAQEAAANQVHDYGKTEPLRFGGVGDYGKTEAVGGFGGGTSAPGGIGGTSAPGGFSGTSVPGGFNGGTAGPGGTLPPEDYGATTAAGFTIDPINFHKDGEQNVTTPIFSNNQPGFLPVVGWLVCIEGPEKGKDYRIHAGYNNIGRSPSMDIELKFDKNISREKDCYVGYDQEEKEFFFGHDNGKNIIRVNGKRVNGSTDLTTYDILTIGSCKYMFVALCGEKFDWSDMQA